MFHLILKFNLSQILVFSSILILDIFGAFGSSADAGDSLIIFLVAIYVNASETSTSEAPTH